MEETSHRAEQTSVPHLKAHCLGGDGEDDEPGASWKALQRQGHLDRVSKNEEELTKAQERTGSVCERTMCKGPRDEGKAEWPEHGM